MKIDLKEITVRELADGYADNQESGVVAFGGKLDVRPPYQREFIYKTKQRNAVIDTVQKDFPLNVMYWAVRGDGGFEIIDGQQRTISLCQYVKGDFSLNGLYFHNLQDDKQNQILDYKLMVYQCTGTDSEKLEWFRTINIAGEKLTDQELRNAVYSGPWVSDAKRYFSKTGGPAYGLGGDYMNGAPIRQEYLETVIDWTKDKPTIEEYMGVHQHDENASPLWHYFQSVINWVKATFPTYRKEMKGIEWGFLYNRYKDTPFDTDKLEKQAAELMSDDDVTKKSGIYSYLLTGEEKHLSIRQFSANQRREAYERQKGICVKCAKHFDLNEMEADHITPWHEGGKTSAENCQLLCKDDNRRKGGR
ncbi:MAG TPA: DUF262 domain-containing protein [Pyrinomonadaceae bacterium]|nr:DUF262 domain-containing protein [Pyrinomonadaceae bacterium]